MKLTRLHKLLQIAASDASFIREQINQTNTIVRGLLADCRSDRGLTVAELVKDVKAIQKALAEDEKNARALADNIDALVEAIEETGVE